MQHPRIPVPSPIHLAASKPGEGHRFSYSDVAAFIPGGGPAILAATDGRMAAYVPVLPPDIRPEAGRVLLPASACKVCRVTKRNPLPLLTVNGAAETPDGTRHELPPQEASFPPVADVLPDETRIRKAETVISVNPELLLKLAEALGSSDRVSIVWQGERNAMVVLPAADAPDGALGILMPTAATSSAVQDEAGSRIRLIRNQLAEAATRKPLQA